MAFLKSFVTETFPQYLESLPVPANLDDVKNLSPDDWMSLSPAIIFFLSPAILWGLSIKIRHAFNLNENMPGIFQYSDWGFQGTTWSGLPYLLSYVPGLLAVLATFMRGNVSWLVFLAGYVLVPIADLIIGENSYNPTKEQEEELKKRFVFRAIMLGYTPSYIATIIYACYKFQEAELAGNPYSNAEFWGVTAGVGIAGGFGIGCVHELIHRPNAAELLMGITATVFANYSHFWIEHLWGHHKRVATDEDPASSRLGDDLYTFLIRDIYQSFTDALDIEAKYVKKFHKGALGFLKNRILIGYTCSALIGYIIYTTFGYTALVFYIAQGVITALHIENANYIEHYGLRRRQVVDANGEKKTYSNGEIMYERPGWFHAWDTGDRLTNYMLFNIQRHPDHHTNAGRPYQILRTFPQSPKMPTGYAGMFVLSWFPPLYWAIMDPLVRNAYNMRAEMERIGDKDKAWFKEGGWFPQGANNMSSFFNVSGEGYFEKDALGGCGSERKDKEAEVAGSKLYKTSFNDEFAKASSEGKMAEAGRMAKKMAEIAKKKNA